MKAEYSGCQPSSMPRIDRCVKIVLDALFPMRCVVCNALDETGLCPDCSATVPRVENPCRRCGVPLGLGIHYDYCGRCLSRPPAFDATIVPFSYAPPMSGTVHRFKYKKRIALGRPLAKVLADEIREREIQLPELLLPVPLHLSRLAKRGFNQSLELGRHLSALLGIPLDRRLIRRNRMTQSQATLPLRDRRHNLQGAFTVARPPPPGRIAIVDDVITSGATMQQISLLLKQNQVNHIQCWSLLRTDF